MLVLYSQREWLIDGSLFDRNVQQELKFTVIFSASMYLLDQNLFTHFDEEGHAIEKAVSQLLGGRNRFKKSVNTYRLKSSYTGQHNTNYT